MAHIFEVKDKSGRIIHLSHERWSHIQKHDRLIGTIEQIQDTLIKPTIMTESDEKDIKSYYRYYKERKEYLRVVVKYLNGKGFMITSYFTKKLQ